MLNNMKKMPCVKEVYSTKRAPKIIYQTYLKQCESEEVKAKSKARSKAGKKKSASLSLWHNCMRTARQNLGIVGKALPKKDTPYYHECKRLMQMIK